MNNDWTQSLLKDRRARERGNAPSSRTSIVLNHDTCNFKLQLPSNFILIFGIFGKLQRPLPPLDRSLPASAIILPWTELIVEKCKGHRNPTGIASNAANLYPVILHLVLLCQFIRLTRSMTLRWQMESILRRVSCERPSSALSEMS